MDMLVKNGKLALICTGTSWRTWRAHLRLVLPEEKDPGVFIHLLPSVTGWGLLSEMLVSCPPRRSLRWKLQRLASKSTWCKRWEPYDQGTDSICCRYHSETEKDIQKNMVENLERKELSFFKIFLNLERERESAWLGWGAEGERETQAGATPNT